MDSGEQLIEEAPYAEECRQPYAEECEGMKVDLDTVLRAFAEGDGDPVYIHPDKTDAMVKGLMGQRSFSPLALISGPVYWAFRKCYGPAAIVAAVGAIFLMAGFIRDSIVPSVGPTLFYLGSAILFFPVYRLRAKRVLRTVRDRGMGPDEAVAYAKRIGDTNIWAAVAISIMFLVVYGAAFLFLYAFGML